MLTITTFSAVTLTLLYLVLSLRVIYLRSKGRGPSIGMSEDKVFIRAVRAHGNFSEYAPLFLILLALYEFQGGAPRLVLTLAVVFILARCIHAYGLSYFDTGRLRTIGMVGTVAALLALSFLLFTHAFIP